MYVKRNTLVALMTTSFMFAPTQAFALDQTWVGNWRIIPDDSISTCIARTEYAGTEVALAAKGDNGQLLLANQSWSFIKEGNSYHLIVNSDKSGWSGKIIGRAWNDGTFGFVFPGNLSFVNEIADSKGIEVIVEEGTEKRSLVTLRLTESRDALDAAKECTEKSAAIWQQKSVSARNDGRVWPLYRVDGLALGERVHFGSAAYSAYQCSASDQFDGFTWCKRDKQEKTGKSSNSILHRADGTTSYINRYIRPTTLTEREAKKEIERLSAKFGEKAVVLNMPKRKGFPNAIIAKWGQVELLPLDKDGMSALAADGSPRKGLLIDFLGDLWKSGKANLPVYMLSGGAGYVWSASFDQKSIGHLRFLAIDASTLSRPEADQASASDAPPENPVAKKSDRLQSEESPSSGTEQSRGPSSGTGIVVSKSGHILTNHHVVGGCSSVKVMQIGDLAKPARVLRSDTTNDLALLKTDETYNAAGAARFRVGTSVKPGESIAVFGYPLVGALSFSGNIVSGSVTSLSGIADDVRFLQISSSIQPGNSGGPLLDSGGLLIGVVSSQINQIAVAQRTGSIPQNVNFAIKGTVAMNFLEAHSIPFETSSGATPLPLTDIAAEAKSFTVLVTCE